MWGSLGEVPVIEMKGALAVSVKEALHIVRDPRSLYLNLGIPVVLLLILGYAISFELRREPVGYLDLDHSAQSRKLIALIGQEESFGAPFPVDPPFFPYLRSGKARLILIIPHNFSSKIEKGEEVTLQVLLDGADNNTASIALGTVEELLMAQSDEGMRENLRNEGIPLSGKPITPSLRILYNPALKSVFFIVPGLIALIMMIVSALMTALTVAREWETGTLEKLLISPLSKGEIILGKTLPYFLLGFIQISLILLAGRIVFGVPFRGSIPLLVFFSALFLIGGLGVGLLVSVATRTQQLAMQVTWILTILPGFLLSGFLFPIESMPKVLQAFTYLVPARYYLVVLRGILLKGAGLAELWSQAAFLGLYAAIAMIAAVWRFPRRLA